MFIRFDTHAHIAYAAQMFFVIILLQMVSYLYEYVSEMVKHRYFNHEPSNVNVDYETNAENPFDDNVSTCTRSVRCSGSDRETPTQREFYALNSLLLNNGRFTEEMLPNYCQIRNQEIGLVREGYKLKAKLQKMRDRYKELCLELESKRASVRMPRVEQEVLTLAEYNVKKYFADESPSTLNEVDRETYVDYLVLHALHELHNINNVVMGELLDDDVITTLMEACQKKYPETLFVNPCLTQCVQFCRSEEVASFLEPINAKRYDNVFFVINDTSNGDEGSHWSLLLVSRECEAFCHYDSLRGVNYRVALELYKKLRGYFQVWRILEARCEQQTNSTDCGVYVLDNMLRIVLALNNKLENNGEAVSVLHVADLPSSFTKTRIYMMNTYISCVVEKVRRLLGIESTEGEVEEV